MKQLLLVLLILGCVKQPSEHLCDSHELLRETTAAPAAGGELGTAQLALLAPNPIAFRRHGSSAFLSRGQLFEAMECATLRIKTSVCIDIDMTISPYSNMVRWENAVDMPNDSSGHVSGASWATQRIRISDALPPESWCTVLVHEMVHVLRRSYAHPGPQYGMSYPVTYTHTSTSLIIQDDIDRICAKQTCECQVPETLPS